MIFSPRRQNSAILSTGRGHLVLILGEKSIQGVQNRVVVGQAVAAGLDDELLGGVAAEGVGGGLPAGGGGLLAGMALAAHLLNPRVKVYGVQAEGASAFADAFRQDKWAASDSAVTFADGIQVKVPGTLNFEMVEKYVDDIVTVSDDEIAAAILALMERQKLVAEGAGATPVAACMFGHLPVEGKRVVCVISGGNIDVNILSRVINRGLAMSGRKVTLSLKLTDKPGQLEQVSHIIAELGANVVSVDYDLTDPDLPISSCILRVGMETRDNKQIEEIRQHLQDAGFSLAN